MSNQNHLQNRNLFGQCPVCKPVLEGLQTKIVPDRWEPNRLELITVRMTLIKYSSFSLISKDWIKPFAKWIDQRRCLEIMAGHGMLSKALRDEGVNVIATTDDYTWETPPIDLTPELPWFHTELFWTNVEKMDVCEAIRKYGNDTDLFLCSWPPYEEPVALHALRQMREVNPESLFVFFGEGAGGCTADDAFFEEAVPVDDDDFEACFVNYKTWPATHDRPQLYR